MAAYGSPSEQVWEYAQHNVWITSFQGMMSVEKGNALRVCSELGEKAHPGNLCSFICYLFYFLRLLYLGICTYLPSVLALMLS